MKKKIMASLLIVFVVATIVGCGVQEKTRVVGKVVSQPEPIKMGSILILTGEGAAWGIAARNGIDMAVEEINAEGGINGRMLEVTHEDDQSNAKNALSAYRKLTSADGIDIIIGTTWSHTGVPLIELADQEEVLMVSPSLGVKDFNEGSPFLFNTWPHDFYLSADLADYVFEKGHRKVALIGANQLWVVEQTKAFVERFEELGGSIEVLLEPNPGDLDPYVEALKIKAIEDEIDAVVSTTDGVVAGVLVAKQMRVLGVEQPLYSITIDADTLAAAQGAYEGMHYLTFLTPSDEFETRYVEKFKKDVEIGADSAYDAVMMIAKAMRETGSTDTEVLQQYLNGIETYDGASGDLVSDGMGGFIKDLIALEVQEGVPVQVA